jgi:3-oxoacyl-ACP reductase-like protein
MMGFFSKILEKLGIGSPAAAPAPAPAAPPAPAPAAAATPATPAAAPSAPPPPKPIALVDVVAQLEQRAAANPQKLNWRTSIVDLLKLLEIDSSLAARKELATELGCPAELMGDSAKMNMWLHKTVLARIAANGGNVPKDLLD